MYTATILGMLLEVDLHYPKSTGRYLNVKMGNIQNIEIFFNYKSISE